MNLQELKQKARKLKEKTVTAGKNALDYSAQKLASSTFTLKTKEQLELFIKKSESTKTKNSVTGEEKIYIHRVIIIFAETKSEFFTSFLYGFPILSTKAFSQNMSLKLADSSIVGWDISLYEISQFPALVVFENMKHIKTISWEENIQKVVKSLSLDINMSIDSL